MCKLDQSRKHGWGAAAAIVCSSVFFIGKGHEVLLINLEE